MLICSFFLKSGESHSSLASWKTDPLSWICSFKTQSRRSPVSNEPIPQSNVPNMLLDHSSPFPVFWRNQSTLQLPSHSLIRQCLRHNILLFDANWTLSMFSLPSSLWFTYWNDDLASPTSHACTDTSFIFNTYSIQTDTFNVILLPPDCE